MRGVGVRGAQGRESWEDWENSDLASTEARQPIVVMWAGEGSFYDNGYQTYVMDDIRLNFDWEEELCGWLSDWNFGLRIHLILV